MLGKFYKSIQNVSLDLDTFADFLARLQKDELVFERVEDRRWKAKWYNAVEVGYVIALPVGDSLTLDFYLLDWDQGQIAFAYEEDGTIEWEPTVWHKVFFSKVEKGLQELGILRGEVPDDDLAPKGGKYGTDRDLTFDDVQAIVKRCRNFQEGGGKVPDFYNSLNLDPNGPRYYALDTLRGWLKNPKFKLT